MSASRGTRLNKRFCDQVEVTKRTDFPDDAERGLRLRVTPNGANSWLARYIMTRGE